jgi:uncharacterized membrane protein
MRMNGLVLFGLVAAILFAMPAQAMRFLPLGDLSDGLHHSEAHGVSVQGGFVVGCGNSGQAGVGDCNEAVRWSIVGGEIATLQSLSEPLGQNYFRVARDVSADGQTIVGQGKVPLDSIDTDAAMIWKPVPGPQNIGFLAGDNPTALPGDPQVTHESPGPGLFQNSHTRPVAPR